MAFDEKVICVSRLIVSLVGFCLFLYFVPPFFTAAPETFSKPTVDAAPLVSDITDSALRLVAERGRYLVVTGGCAGCHQVPTPEGPDLSRYLGGGPARRRPGPRSVPNNRPAG